MKIDSDNMEFFAKVTKAQPELFAFVASMLPFSPDDVQDVTQDVNLKLIQHAAEYDPARPFKPWMYRLARNTVINYLNATSRERVSFDDDTVAKCAETLADESQAEPEDSSTLKRLAICKRKLSDRHRRLVDLRYTRLFSIPEIGKDLDMSVVAVNAALVYIRKKLYDCLKRLCRIDDRELETSHPDAFDGLLNACIDSPSPTDEEKERLFSLVQSSEECRTRYLEQMFMHQMLVWETSKAGRLCRDALVRLRAKRAFLRVAVLAAGLAAIIGGLIWAFPRHLVPAAVNVVAVKPNAAATPTGWN